MEIPFNDQPPSPKFKEDLKRYQAKRLETWCNNTVLTKRKIVGTDGKTRVVQVRTVELEDTAWYRTTSRIIVEGKQERPKLAKQEERSATPTSKSTGAVTRNVPQDCSATEAATRNAPQDCSDEEGKALLKSAKN